jgi:hypothetical protein
LGFFKVLLRRQSFVFTNISPVSSSGVAHPAEDIFSQHDSWTVQCSKCPAVQVGAPLALLARIVGKTPKHAVVRKTQEQLRIHTMVR